MLSCIFDGLELNQSGNRYTIADPEGGVDWGTSAVAGALLTGQYRLEEYDAVAASMNLTRTVSMRLRITSPNSNAMVTDQQAITSRLAGANRFVPKTLTVTPDGSSHVSTFNVYGGSWSAPHDHLAEKNTITVGDLTLICDWPVRGASQSLGSSGSPLVSNAASPAAVTLSPSPVGDVPGDVTLFVKNRDAAAIRSAVIAGISQNTTWVAGTGTATGWTADAQGVISAGVLAITISAPPTIALGAHFTAPTLPSDRRFRVYLRAHTADAQTPPPSIRLRLVSGQTEVISPWFSLPQETASANIGNALNMGAYTFPVGQVGSLGAQATTVYIEALGNGPAGGFYPEAFNVYEAFFVPDDSVLILETSDTGKTLAAAAATIQVESDQVYDSTGNSGGGVVTGANIRTLGGKYYVYASKGYMGSLDSTLPWAPANVDAWATFTPRGIGLL